MGESMRKIVAAILCCSVIMTAAMPSAVFADEISEVITETDAMDMTEPETEEPPEIEEESLIPDEAEEAPETENPVRADNCERIAIKGIEHYEKAYDVLDLVNRERQAAGESPLVMDAALLECAMQRAAEIVIDFDHIRPDGSLCFSIAPGWMIAENIAAGPATAAGVMGLWMNSEGHRNNILSSSSVSIGIGCFEYEGDWYWVQAFGGGDADPAVQPADKTAIRQIDFEAGRFAYTVSPASIEAYKGDTIIPSVSVQGEESGRILNIENSTLLWESRDPSVATVNNGQIICSGIGDTQITVSASNGTPVGVIPVSVDYNVKVSYQTHVQTYGWQEYVTNGEMSGTTGQSKRLEGIRIKLTDQPYEGGISYQTHVQTYGWQDWKNNGEMAGTSGESKRLEAIQIRLTGEMAEHYDVYYQTHIQNFGWSGWASNGEQCGSAGYSYRLEGIRIMLVRKGKQGPSSSGSVFYLKPGTSQITEVRTSGAMVGYNTHVQTYGWQDYAYDGAMAGTSGQSKRLEGIHIQLIDKPYAGDIVYRTHVQTYGWQEWKKNGDMSGTSGESKRLEGIEIYLTGQMADRYDVYYRVHAQTYGWLDWAKNGEMAGTSGLSKRLEGICIVLVPKGGQAPGSTARPNVVRTGA